MNGRLILNRQNGKSFLLAAIIIFICQFVAFSQTPARENQLEYHGFKVNYEQIKDAPQKEQVLKAVQRQIEIVEQVKLNDDFIKFFKTVPIVMIPDASGTPGIYGNIKKIVLLKGRDLDANKPILLHEFLHAYHDLKIPDGFQNEQIRKFYEEAVRVYPNYANTYFLSNNREFFAVTASIYLFGNIPRPPFNLQTIKTAQPEYYQFLEKLFARKHSE